MAGFAIVVLVSFYRVIETVLFSLFQIRIQLLRFYINSEFYLPMGQVEQNILLYPFSDNVLQIYYPMTLASFAECYIGLP